jgi:DnaA family protein|tara:strand:+ start:896 stop:1498 length:603 start_codon:yes stop_codon:yes gene_type:complete
MDQLLLDIHKPANKTIKNFVIGNNAECINSLNKFLDPLSPIFFIYLWGENGCGKSHLAEVVKRQNITVIDNIQNSNNKKQIEIFNLYNQYKEEHKKLLVTGTNSPTNMKLRDDLSSRLSWGLVYQLKGLTDIEKMLALEHHAKEKGMSLDLKIINYCMKNLKRDLHSLIATLDALDEWSLKTKKPITIPLLKNLITNIKY